jgi:glycosyltransferase involved in cell wall biosynthesis
VVSLNIAIVNEFFPPFVTGGAELFLDALADYLTRRGHKIVVITTDQGQEKSGRFRQYRIRPSPFHFSHRYQFHGLTVPWMFFNKGLAKRLEGIYKREGIDLVYVNNLFHMSFAPLQAAESLGLPMVLDMHDLWPMCFTKDLYFKNKFCTGEHTVKCAGCVAGKTGMRFIAPLLLPGLWLEKRLRKKNLNSPMVKAKIAHSENGIKFFENHGLGSGISIPYPYMGRIGKHKSSKDGVFRILFISRLEEPRGADLVLKIAKGLKNRIDYRIDVVGEGSYKEALDRKDLGIHVHGFLGKERFDYFRQADCVLNLAKYPVPFGITVIEAMAYQAAVVSLEDTGPSELIKENDIGISRSPERLAAGIEMLAKNPKLMGRFRKNGHRNIARYEKATIMKKYEYLFRSIVHKTLKSGGVK